MRPGAPVAGIPPLLSGFVLHAHHQPWLDVWCERKLFDSCSVLSIDQSVLVTASSDHTVMFHSFDKNLPETSDLRMTILESTEMFGRYGEISLQENGPTIR